MIPQRLRRIYKLILKDLHTAEIKTVEIDEHTHTVIYLKKPGIKGTEIIILDSVPNTYSSHNLPNTV